MLKLVFANVGGGKSTYLAAQAYNKKNIKKYGSNIYSNFYIKGVKKFEIQDLGLYEIQGALLLIDEAGLDVSNLVTLTERMRYFVKMHRHYYCDIIVASQSYEDVNVVFRRLYDKMYMMRRTIIPHVSIYREIKPVMAVDPTDHQIKDMYFEHPIPRLLFRKKYYKYFDSFSCKKLKDKDFELWDDVQI